MRQRFSQHPCLFLVAIFNRDTGSRDLRRSNAYRKLGGYTEADADFAETCALDSQHC